MKPMLATTYERQDVTGWLMSEKLDGIRAIWDGEKLLSRNGNAFAAPAWFTASLPAGVALDGELWMGRGKFQATASVVRKKTPVDSEWRGITYMVFDAPNHPRSFLGRLAFAAGQLPFGGPAKILSQSRVGYKQSVGDFFREITMNGGEGIMIRDADSLYEFGKRSKSLLKFKPFSTDEGELVGSEIGSGRLAGLAGAFLLKWKGKVIRIGTGINDSLRHTPPKIGSKITFSFEGLTDGGLPRFPALIGVRDYE